MRVLDGTRYENQSQSLFILIREICYFVIEMFIFVTAMHINMEVEEKSIHVPKYTED